MKRKYVTAVLLLLGLGIVSTLAFVMGDLDASSVAGPISVTQTGTGENVDEVHVFPYQSPDGVYMKMVLDTSVTTSYVFSLAIEDDTGPIDLSGGTYSYKMDGSWSAPASLTSLWDADDGTVTITASGTGTSLKLRVYGVTDLYLDAVTILIYQQSLT
ncbi:MAG: hypothetical protein ABIJ47_07705 [Candidatus Bathyarchaeota archaeon]